MASTSRLRWLRPAARAQRDRACSDPQYGGFEVKTIGDAFMVAFGALAGPFVRDWGSARDSRYGATIRSMRCGVRIGLHAGEPVREGNDFQAAASSSPRASQGKPPAARSSRRAVARADGECRRHPFRCGPRRCSEGLRRNPPSVSGALGVTGSDASLVASPVTPSSESRDRRVGSDESRPRTRGHDRRLRKERGLGDRFPAREHNPKQGRRVG